MKIQDIISFLENIAPVSLQESYDNAGLITGNLNWDCTGVITALDSTESVIEEAIAKKCNLIVAHHPIIFSGLKKITGKNYVENTIIKAIKNDIAIYAIHTNLDNIIEGVNGKIASMLHLSNIQIILPKANVLKKLVVFVPINHAEKLRNAIFSAGGGHIGEYSECSFNTLGEGTFKAGNLSNPFVGEKGVRHTENEVKIEVIFPSWKEKEIINIMKSAHPYEVVAHDILPITNSNQLTGSGLIGELTEPMLENDFLKYIKNIFNVKVVRHTALLDKPVKKIAVCGGAGSFLINAAIAAGADFFITGDVKYHEFFDANNRLVVADIGHYESEQFTIDLLFELLSEKFINFAVLKTTVNTNPISYFI